MLCLILGVFLSLFSSSVQAKDYRELDIGAFATYHTFKGAYTKQLKRQMSSDGALVNNTPHVSLSFINVDSDIYKKFTMFYVKDCIDQSSYGAFYSFGMISESTKGKLGFLIGGYVIQTPQWKKIDVAPYWSDLSKNTGLVPLIGLSLEYEIIRIKAVHLDFKSLVSIPIIHGGFTLGVDF